MPVHASFCPALWQLVKVLKGVVPLVSCALWREAGYISSAATPCGHNSMLYQFCDTSNTKQRASNQPIVLSIVSEGQIDAKMLFVKGIQRVRGCVCVYVGNFW